MYSLFIDDRLGAADIAKIFNAEGIPAEFDRPWTGLKVLGILSNRKYIGMAVYNRTSKKLGGTWRRNPEREWIKGEAAHEAIVSREKFEQAQKRLAEIAQPTTKNNMLDCLTALWCRHGHLSSLLVDRAPGAPSGHTYAARFGSLAKAFKLIGFKNKENIGRNAELRKALIREIIEQVTKRGGCVEPSPWNKQLTINGEIKVGILISRLKSKGPRTWQFGYVSQSKPDIIIGARIAERGASVVDYFILPFMFLPHGTWITTSVSSGARLERFRSATLQPFYDLCARQQLQAPRW